MASAQVLDFAALLAPIPGPNPSGTDVRHAGDYSAIEEARRADDDLPQGEWTREVKVADWATVIKLATDTLAAKSKDLQIAAWLAEALVKRHGFAGLRDGLRLLRGLVDQFWDSVYPILEDGDVESRLGPFTFLNAKLSASVRAVPLTEAFDGTAYTWLHWQQSRAVDNLERQNPEAYQAALDEGKITGDRFDKAVASTPRAFYEALAEDLNQCREEYDQTAQVVDQRFGREAPSLLTVKAALEECRTLVDRLVRDKRQLEPDAAPVGAITASPGAPEGRSGATAMGGSGAVPFMPRDRADALSRLSAVAEFFRRTEPHSPVAYLVKRAVQWGEMPLEAWLQEVIGDDAVLARVRETLGLKEQAAGSE